MAKRFFEIAKLREKLAYINCWQHIDSVSVDIQFAIPFLSYRWIAGFQLESVKAFSSICSNFRAENLLKLYLTNLKLIFLYWKYLWTIFRKLKLFYGYNRPQKCIATINISLTKTKPTRKTSRKKNSTHAI